MAVVWLLYSPSLTIWSLGVKTLLEHAACVFAQLLSKYLLGADLFFWNKAKHAGRDVFAKNAGFPARLLDGWHLCYIDHRRDWVMLQRPRSVCFWTALGKEILGYPRFPYIGQWARDLAHVTRNDATAHGCLLTYLISSVRACARYRVIWRCKFARLEEITLFALFSSFPALQTVKPARLVCTICSKWVLCSLTCKVTYPVVAQGLVTLYLPSPQGPPFMITSWSRSWHWRAYVVYI